MNAEPAWLNGLKASIIVCDPEGKILFLNSTAAQQYAKDGGAAPAARPAETAPAPASAANATTTSPATRPAAARSAALPLGAPKR